MSDHLPAAAVVPTAPLLLSAVSPDQPAGIREAVADLRRDVIGALESLPRTDAVILVAAGPRGLHDAAVADLACLGVEAPTVQLPVATQLIEDLTRLTQYPRFRGEPLNIELTVMVRLVERVLGEVAVVPLSVPVRPEADVLRAVGASINEALEDQGGSATLLVAGDLSAALDETSPAYVVEGAAFWDAAVTSAFEHGDLGALARLGPDEAARVHARGWAPLVVLNGAASAARLVPTDVRYHAPRGVGQLVARMVPTSERPGGRYEIAGGRTGVLDPPDPTK